MKKLIFLLVALLVCSSVCSAAEYVNKNYCFKAKIPSLFGEPNEGRDGVEFYLDAQCKSEKCPVVNVYAENILTEHKYLANPVVKSDLQKKVGSWLRRQMFE